MCVHGPNGFYIIKTEKTRPYQIVSVSKPRLVNQNFRTRPILITPTSKSYADP